MGFWLRRPIEGYALGPLTEHRDGFFVSSGSSWFETMQQLRATYDRATGRQLKPSPDAAWEPMWVPWAAPKGQWGTVAQEDLGPDELWEMAVLAKELGFRAVTNSGSWFIESDEKSGDDSTGWGYPNSIGDFTPSRKFRDMKAFASRLRGIDMTWLPWISPWLAGRDTRTREALKDAMIEVDLDPSHPEYGVCRSYLCPRNPRTQEFVPDLVAGLMREY